MIRLEINETLDMPSSLFQTFLERGSVLFRKGDIYVLITDVEYTHVA
ncbi:MAG: hypothetical protein RJA61_282 [Candidatus Parcubacteria bacterium]